MVAGVRRVFDLIADDYDNVGVSFFQPIADGLVDAVGAAPGDRALDLGCGSGTSSRALAAAVGPGGSLVGLDLSPAMVERARRSLEGSPVDVTLLVGDASDPDLPAASFDVAISSLVLFFLPEPAAALSRWVRLVAPGGRIGLSTFGPSNEQWQSLEAPLREFMPPLDPRSVGPQSPFASDEGMAALLADAGATDVRTTSRRVEFGFEGFDQWLRFSRSVGQRVAWERMTQDDTARVLEETRRRFDEAAAPDGTLPAWQQVRYTVGSLPTG
ncbi:ubiquinone/menaquinone biosynthesis C-methylase UbiE [Humibacillus xanthopallidus]|uniref:Ubiquinone/menaquinone biosynthesis C-methylase UbiE n=2 Tax=Humibacillus xanthopallidus TaxID=412689 RepID=A0A543PPU1_9MICO|nr:ubiquinone/menaquinone biosynthesis C-methylase UbiE [Humibacillus xanthopallidus]